MSLKSKIGLDWFDFAIHAGVTGMLMVIAGNAMSGRAADAGVSIVATASLVVLAWRRARAVRWLPPAENEPDHFRLQELEARVGELEAQQGRMLELEERLDFTERVLARQRLPADSPAMLPVGFPPPRRDP
jgi:hypothetical protein